MKTKILLCIMVLILIAGCAGNPSSDRKQRQQNEVLLQEATSQVGMPAIKNFRERKLLRDIIEMRDQNGLVTYTYFWNEFNGKLVYLGESVGYGIPYATQFTNPEKLDRAFTGSDWQVMKQADPNGLFSPESAEGTWILLKDPNSDAVKPVYVEPKIVVSPFKLPESIVISCD